MFIRTRHTLLLIVGTQGIRVHRVRRQVTVVHGGSTVTDEARSAIDDKLSFVTFATRGGVRSNTTPRHS